MALATFSCDRGTLAYTDVSIESFLGSSQAMGKVRAFARRAARVDVPVLILGETGTGKSLLGRVIHQESGRASHPYLAINCAGIPDTLFESEFFGHVRGAFTGARDARKGLLEQARGGSLFLDEVGELPQPQQAKLLTAIEDGEIRRLGGEGAVRVDVRILAATSRDLAREMKKGGFRRDLFHRLAVLTCHIPPLRARPEDVPVLARRFLRRLLIRHDLPSATLPAEGLRFLQSQPWHGNVRELFHLLEAALILSDGADLGEDALETAGAMGGMGPDSVEVQEVRMELLRTRESSPQERDGNRERGRGKRRYAFAGSVEEEREAVLSAMARSRGNKAAAARELGMSRNTLRAKLTRFSLDP